MSYVKNSFIVFNNGPADKGASLVEGVPFSFRSYEIPLSTTYPVSTGFFTLIPVPIDYVTFGRVAPLSMPSSTATINNLVNYQSTDVNTNFGFGVTSYYWGVTIDRTSFPKPVINAVGTPNTFLNITSVTSTDKLSFIENFLITVATTGKTPYYVGASILCSRVSAVELMREINYDGYILHYVSLVKMGFAYKGTTMLGTTTKSYASSSTVYVNVLIDFKFTLGTNREFQFYGLDILNDNFIIITDTISLTEPTTSNNYSIQNQWSSTSFLDTPPYLKSTYKNKSTNGLINNMYISYNDSKKDGNITNGVHIAYPGTSILGDINHFGTFLSPSGICVYYDHVNEICKYYYFDWRGSKNGANAYPITWRYSGNPVSYEEQSYWKPSGFLSYQAIPPNWSLNPSGNITSNGWNFPVVLSQDDSSYRRKMSLCTSAQGGYTIDYSTTSGLSIQYGGTVLFYNNTLRALTKEPTLAAFMYTYASTTFNVLYMLTPYVLYVAVFGNSTGAIFQYSPPALGLLSVYATNPLSTSIAFEISTDTKSEIHESINLCPSTSSITETRIGASNTYYLTLTFRDSITANAAGRNMSLWEVRHTDFSDYTKKIPIDLSHTLISSNHIYLYIDLSSYIQSNPYSSLTNLSLYVRGVDLGLPYIFKATGFVDARPLNLGNVSLTYDGVTYPLSAYNNGYTNGVIHTNKSKLTQYQPFQLQCDGEVDNIYKMVVTVGVDTSTWTGDPTKATYASYTLPCNNFNLITKTTSFICTIPAPAVNQFIVRAPNPKSCTTPNSVLGTIGSYGGMIVTITNNNNQNVSYYLPVVTVYDDHKFILAKLPHRDFMSVEYVSNSGIIAPVDGSFYNPPLASSYYRFGCSFRCAPNYFNDVADYSLNYEGPVAQTVSNRLSTPMIYKWWLLAIPSNAKLPPLGGLQNITNELDKSTSISTVNFDTNHDSYYRVGGGQIYETLRKYTYINSDPSVLINYFNGAVAGTNLGCFWNSDTLNPTSGYLDFYDLQFTKKSGNVSIISGCIDTGSYGIIFIAQDSLSNYTCIDLGSSNILDLDAPVFPTTGNSNFSY